MDKRNQIGTCGEKIACKHISRLGFRVLERNFRTRYGELDLIYRDGESLVFCEVKTRIAGVGRPLPDPIISVGPAKQRKLRQLAGIWLYENGAGPARKKSGRYHPRSSIRFDVIGVIIDRRGRPQRVNLVRDAFR